MKVRIANNKNIQNMEQKDIDIYEILKDVEYGTELYTPMCGKVVLTCLTSSNEMIRTDKYTRIYRFDKNGRWEKEGEVMLFPSAEMRDWSKFFKKGDVLEYAGDDEGLQGSCTFEKFEDETKTRFLGRYVKEKEALYSKRPSSLRTADWVKSDDPADYIRFVEERLGGKLNRKTLEIEKAQPDFKDGDIVLEEGNRNYCSAIGVLKKDEQGCFMFDTFLTKDKVCYNSEYIYLPIRLATEEEKKQFFSALEKEGKAFDAEKKQIVGLKPAFEIGKLYVFREEDEDGELTIIGKLIDKNESEDTLSFGDQYEIENEKFVTDQAFDLRISVHEELREATEDEAVTFQEACTLWEKSKEKKRKEQPPFKPFDKVLVRCGKGFKWLPAFFVRDRGEDFASRYNVLPLHSGKTADFTSCIPYEGHENFAFTDYDFVDLPF